MVKKGFLIAAGALCFVAAGYLFFLMVRAPKDYGPELPPVRMRLAEKLVPAAVGDMRGKLPPTFFRAVLLQFEGHRNAHDVRKMAEDRIVGGKILRLRSFEEIADEAEAPEGFLDKAKDFAETVAGKLGLDVPSPDDKVKEAVKKAGVDGFVGAHVEFLEDSPREERLDITFYATNVDGREVFRERYTRIIAKSVFDLEYYRLSLAEMGLGWRLLIWIVITLCLPVVTWFVPVRVMKKESNGAILGALAAYTALDGVAALALMGFAVTGFLSFLALVLALGLGGVYNYGMFTEIRDFM